jgi:putative ubiquitin-RnfH superfamily antitoxin RatB of RatAB toxin-antitoxin module
VKVTVVYAQPGAQHVIEVDVGTGATVRQAIAASGLLAPGPGQALDELEVGIWNHRCSLDTVVREGDRIEVYRPLQVDPKEARRIRAEVRRRRPG